MILLQLVGEKGYFRQARRIFQRYEAHYFAVIGFGPAGGGDKARYCDFFVYELFQPDRGHVFDPEQYRRVYAERNACDLHLGF